MGKVGEAGHDSIQGGKEQILLDRDMQIHGNPEDMGIEPRYSRGIDDSRGIQWYRFTSCLVHTISLVKSSTKRNELLTGIVKSI